MEIEVNPKQAPWPIIGLTGNIACGKTLATDFLKTQGFAILDADVIARDLVKLGTAALIEIQKVFGPAFLLPDGALDRAKLNALIFTDAKAKQQLESILHPRILANIQENINTLLGHQPKPYIILSAPLLFEGGLNQRCSKVMLIDCTPALQTQRLQTRNGFSPAAALVRMNSQQPASQKRPQSHWIVENNSTQEAFLKHLMQRVPDMKAHLNTLLGNK